MATKPPAKAAPKSTGKAATKPAAKTKAAPAKKPAPAPAPAKAKSAQSTPTALRDVNKFKAEQDGPVDNRPATAEELEDAHLGMKQAEEMGENLRKHGTIDKPAEPMPWEDEEAIAEQQAELNSLAALMASARADITPNDTERPEPAPAAPKYREVVSVHTPVATSGAGTLSMADVFSARKKPTTRQVSPVISRLLNLR